MRTNIDIDDVLMTQAMIAAGVKTKKEAVDAGLRTLIRLDRQQGIRQLRGKIEWIGDLDAMRRD